MHQFAHGSAWALAVLTTSGGVAAATGPDARPAEPLAVTASSTPAPVTLDVEVDPLAYVLSGYSVHAGVRFQRLRFDLGAFGVSVPEAFRATAALSERQDGFGIKVDYLFTTGRWVPFAGLSVSHTLVRLQEPASGIAVSSWSTAPAVRAGQQVDVAWGFYLSPWVSLGYALEDRPDDVAGVAHDPSPWLVFPTVHLGWRAP